MSKWSRDGEDIMRDLVIAFKHPDYRDRDPVSVLAELKEARR